MRKLAILFTLLYSLGVLAQELNCTVSVIAQQTGNDNNVVFRNLEKQLNEFISNTQWTDKNYSQQERIDCNMVINVQEYNNDLFAATLQVSSSRPVYNSTYNTPVYNYNDKSFNFRYLEFQNLVYNPIQFESNLISVLAFHVYMILGMDADTFELNGGSEYFKQAQIIANYSQQLNGQGWKLEDGLQSRFALIDNLMSPTFKEFRTTMYEYHINGLDLMHEDTKKGKTKLTSVLEELQKIHRRRPNSFLMRVFFDAKSDEIMDILSGGPSVNITDSMDILNRIAPTYSQKWRNIKF
jgi:predicted CopG family antitoxin